MKRLLPILIFTLTGGLILAQGSFSDDFEAYNEGAYIGNQMGWSTWSGTPGGADDAMVTTEEAYSGTNSVKFESFSPNGGPADVILPMPYRLNRGSLIFKFWIYVVDGTAGYFNFQGGSSPGQSWSAEVFFDDNGAVRVVSAGTLRLEGSFEHGKWFEVEFRIDFNKNAWEGIIDGQCLGIFTNDAGLNSVGSIDFFPVNSGNPSSNASVYFIDDVSYEASLDGLEEVELDASISDITLNSRALTGTDVQIGGVLRNNGSNNITSFEVMFDGGGTQFTESFDNLDIASNSTYEFTTSETYTYEEGMNDLSLSLVSVNGQADEKTCNDVRQTTAQGITPAPGKRVLSEEATGTWCGWCPRGEVFIGIMEDRYDDYFVPIAVHQGDPMENDHIGYITSVIPGFAGYPNMVIDRMDWFGFGTVESIENFFFEDIDDAPVGTMDVGAEWDGRTLKVSNALNFDQDSESGMALEVILVENNVTGTGPGYAQINYYAGGGRGPMGGYENLPSPVPADQMVYNHVSRGSFSGHANHSIDGNYTGGDRYLANFAMNVPDTYDDSELLLVALVLNADGSVNNVTEVSLQEAIDNGFEMTTSSDDIQVINDLNVYPNPALNSTFVELDLAEGTNVRIDVINSLGGIVASRDYGKISGSYTFPVDLGNMNAGVYQIQIWVNDEFTTRSLNVIK